MRRALFAVAVAAAFLATGGVAAAGLGAGVEVDRHEETGRVGFVGAPPGKPIEVPGAATAREAAVKYVNDNARAFGVAGRGSRVAVERVTPTATGRAVRLRQVEHGLQVLGGELVVNVDRSGKILSVLGETSPTGRIDPDPAVSASDAAETGIAVVARAEGVDPDGLEASRPELQLYDPRLLGAPGPFQHGRPAWVFEVTSRGPVTTLDELVVVDAELGNVALHFGRLETALERRVCDADNSPSQVPCTAPVRVEGGPPAAEPDVNFAYDYAGETYELFDELGRDSLDGAGMPLISTVDYCEPGECPYANAFWDGEQMVYGDGYAAADDVVGHELAHGVTEFSSRLFYYFQSGAINESLSDVFGELVDLRNGTGSDGPTDRWRVGEDIPGFPSGLRDMENPPTFGHPDRMGSPLYADDPDELDFGGVHTNSGANNKAAYLLADGGSFNGRTVATIGLAKVARLYYEVNDSMLVSGSDYADLANALRQKCAELAGAGVDGFTGADCASVEQAVLATEMDRSPANAPATDAPPRSCAAGATLVTAFADDLEDPASGNWAATVADPPAYGDASRGAWFYPQNPNVYDLDLTYATSGTVNAWGDDDGDLSNLGFADPDISDGTLELAEPVAVPPGGELRFAHAYGFDDVPDPGTPGPDYWDGGRVEYSTDDGATWVPVPSGWFTQNGYDGTLRTGTGNPLGGAAAFGGESHGYITPRIDLTPLAGRAARFRFRLGTDTVLGDFGWFIDDVSITGCLPAPPRPDPPPTTAADPPPETIITGRTKRIRPRKRARFTFTSNEPIVRFECRVDGARFRPCGSPTRTKRFKRGRHRFEVRAIDAAGQADPTPARAKFRVVRKRRR